MHFKGLGLEGTASLDLYTTNNSQEIQQENIFVSADDIVSTSNALKTQTKPISSKYLHPDTNASDSEECDLSKAERVIAKNPK